MDSLGGTNCVCQDLMASDAAAMGPGSQVEEDGEPLSSRLLLTAFAVTFLFAGLIPSKF